MLGPMKAALLTLLGSLHALLGSKKFMTLIIGATVYGAGRWGWDVNEETLTKWSEGIMVLIGGQSLKDLGLALASRTAPQAAAVTP